MSGKGFCWAEKDGMYCMMNKGHKSKHKYGIVRMSPEVKNLVSGIIEESARKGIKSC